MGGDDRSAMDIVVENGHGDPSSNPGTRLFTFLIVLIFLRKV